MLLSLFGLTEIGSLYIRNPINPGLQAAVGEHNIVFMQHYTPWVKALEEKVILKGRPHLLAYLLGLNYIRNRLKFKNVWNEVGRDRTRLELEEIADPHLPMDARFEVVITEEDSSFLSFIDHRLVTKQIIMDRLLVRVRSVVVLF